MQRISTEGCPVIGKGLFGTVYRIADDKIIKVANDIKKPGTMERLEYEELAAEVLYDNGIPTAQPFGLAEAGDSAGVIYEMVEGLELYDYLEQKPEKSQTMIEGVADILLKLHGCVPQKTGLLKMKDKLLGLLAAQKKALPEAEYEKKKAAYEALPERDTLVHGDLNPGNILVGPDDKPVLIDVGSISTGHPYFEFLNMQQPYLLLSDVEYGKAQIDEFMMKRVGIPDAKEFAARTALLFDFYDRLWKAYFRDLSEEERTLVIGNLKKQAFSQTIPFYGRLTLPDEEKKRRTLSLLKEKNAAYQKEVGPVEAWWPEGF